MCYTQEFQSGSGFGVRSAMYEQIHTLRSTSQRTLHRSTGLTSLLACWPQCGRRAEKDTALATCLCRTYRHNAFMYFTSLPPLSRDEYYCSYSSALLAAARLSSARHPHVRTYAP